jgi:DNA-binding XRE family transcriptional regulator
MSGYVYFFGVDDAMKVGHTNDVRKRLVTAQTMHRSAVELVAVTPGDSEEELLWHRRLADYAIRGEWFALCAGSRRLLAGLSREMPQSPGRAPDEFSRYLTAAISRADISQSELARALGTNPSTVSWWATGRSRPAREMLPGLAAVLGRPVDELAAAVAS